MSSINKKPLPEADSLIPAYLMTAIAVFMWAVGVVVARFVREEIPLVGLSFWRWGLAALLLLPFVWNELSAKRHVVKQNSLLFVLQGILLGCGSTLLLYSVNFTTAINATVVNAAQPTATIFLAWLVFRDKFSLLQITGVAVAAAGVILMIAKADWNVLATLDFNKGDMLLIVAITAYGMYSINIRKHSQELSGFASLTCILFMVCLFILPFYLVEIYYVGGTPFTLQSVIAITILVLLVSIFSMICWNEGNKRIGPSKAANFVALVPIYGALLGTLLLGEKFYSYHVAGAALICVGIFLSTRKKYR